jgi:hypothetical protein
MMRSQGINRGLSPISPLFLPYFPLFPDNNVK